MFDRTSNDHHRCRLTAGQVQQNQFGGAAVHSVALAAGRFTRRVANWVSRKAGALLEEYETRRTISALSRLDDRTLQDIGVDRSSIGYAARKAVREGRRR